MDIYISSRDIMSLDLDFQLDALRINILWFRAQPFNKDNPIIVRHRHSSYEFHYIVEGRNRIFTDERKFLVNKGQFYLTGPGIFHEQRLVGDSPSMEYAINCDIELLNNKEYGNTEEIQAILDALNNDDPRAVDDTCGIVKLMDEVFKEASRREIGFYSRIQSLICQIIIQSVRILTDSNSNAYKIPQRSTSYARMEQIHRFIEDNYSEGITLNDISKHMFLSRRQINRIVKHNTGKTAKEYIDGIRLGHVKRALLQGDETVAWIADKCGFSSEYYLSQFFKRHTGMSPSQYRNAMAKAKK